MSISKKAEWALRIGIAGEFIGHGVFGIQGKESWIHYLEAIRIPTEAAPTLLLLIGILDVVLGVLVLIKPWKPALLWMTAWGFMTALIRPIAGEPIWDFIERFANWGAPLALYFLSSRESKE